MTLSEKLAALERVRELLALPSPPTVSVACAAAGISRARFYRWAEAVEAGGPEALIDGKSTGRKPSFALTGEQENRLRWHMLKRESVALAVEDFLRDPACDVRSGDVLRGILDREASSRKRANWPLSVRRACRVTREERARFRGQKAAADTEMVAYRSMQWIDEAGEVHELRPNDLWESDDMSVNEPFRYCDPATGEETVGRQTLITLDVYANRYLGASPIGRPKDAYRAEDILEHMLGCVDAWGLPKFWRLERGRWENHAIDGVPLEADFGPDYRGKRWGGLDEVIRIIRAYSSRGKATIESSFNFLQALMAHDSTSIGRKRGEFEDAARDFRRAHAGKGDSLAEFHSIDEAADSLARGMERYNLRGKERRAFGPGLVVPDELYRDAAGGLPTRRELPAGERWRFLPVKKKATVRQGCIETTAPHWPRPFVFEVASVNRDIFLEHGHVVLIAFNPAAPEEGCHVFHADMGARNRAGLRFGEFLFVAPMVSDAPQIDLRSGGESLKKAANAAMRSEFRKIQQAGQPESGGRSSVARDGLGGALRISRGLPVADAAVEASHDSPSRGARGADDAGAALPSFSPGGRMAAGASLPGPATPRGGGRSAAEQLAALGGDDSDFL